MSGTTWIIIAAAAGAAAGVYFYNKKKIKRINGIRITPYQGEHPEIKNVDGCLSMADVVGWFQNLQLNKERHIPFVAKAECFSVCINMTLKPQSLFMGVYDQQADEIQNCIIISPLEWDEELKQIIGNEKLVILN